MAEYYESLIKKLYEIDQTLRLDKTVPVKTVRSFDRFTTQFTKLIYNNKISKMPKDVRNKLLTLFLHTTDIKFLEKVINQDERVFNKAAVAVAIDRILVSKKLPQRYGTIVKTVKTKTGYKTTPLPIESYENIDELRKSVGLGKLEHYLKIAEETYEKIERA